MANVVTVSVSIKSQEGALTDGQISQNSSTHPEQNHSAQNYSAQKHPAKYNVIIGSGLLPQIGTYIDLSNFSQIAVVYDRNISEQHLNNLIAGIPKRGSTTSKITTIPINCAEQDKHSGTVHHLWEEFLKVKLDRHSLVINLGGGSLTDTAGFAAATYMRGVNFIQAPTTLLAQVDASIGGKVGFNLMGVKNLIGCFAQPYAVIADTATLRTLPAREYRSGFAEIIKHALISDDELFAVLEDCSQVNLDEDSLIHILSRSCQIKAEIVELDPLEQNLRKKLNFGHTLGHAVESLSHKTPSPLLHGEAVAIGIIAETKLSYLTGLISEVVCHRIEATLKSYQLPTKIPFSASEEAIMEYIKLDKKNYAGEIRWTLLTGVGSSDFDKTASTALVRAAISAVL
jgi:3-dehydroquinate synthase